MRSKIIATLLLSLLSAGALAQSKVIVVQPDGSQQTFLPEVQPQAPIAPTDLQGAQDGTNARVRLSWTDNSTNETGFRVERGEGQGTFGQLGDVGGDVRTLDDVTVQAGKTYAYRVRAFNAAGVSTWSTVVQVQVLPPPDDGGGEDPDKTYDIPASYTVLSGSDLSAADGQHRVKAGNYTINSLSLKNGADLRAETPGSVIVNVPKGKQVTLGKNVTLCGIVFTGGGLSKDTDGTHAQVVTDDGAYLHTVRVTKSVGVGILMKGTGLTSWYLECDSNGTSGRMIRSRGVNQKPGSGYTEMYAHLHHNNIGGKKSDAANKATQTSEFYSKGLRIHNEDDGGQWFDISCWNCVLDEPYIYDIKTSAEWFRGMGVRYELNCFGTYPSAIYKGRIERVAGAAVSVDESSNIEVTDSVIGKCQVAAEFRQLTRSDDPGDGGTQGPWPKGPNKRQGPGRPGAPSGTPGWVVHTITFARNHYLADAGPMTLSGAGNDGNRPFTKDLKQSTNKISFVDETWDGGEKIKIPK
jgi:hypothetical protein